MRRQRIINNYRTLADPNRWRKKKILAHLLRSCLRSHDLQVLPNIPQKSCFSVCRSLIKWTLDTPVDVRKENKHREKLRGSRAQRFRLSTWGHRAVLKAGIALLLYVRQVTSELNSKLDDRQQRALLTHGTVATSVTKTREQIGLYRSMSGLQFTANL